MKGFWIKLKNLFQLKGILVIPICNLDFWSVSSICLKYLDNVKQCPMALVKHQKK